MACRNANGILKPMPSLPPDHDIKPRSRDVTDGLENAPRELIGLLRGENFGKKLIRVGPAPGVR